MSEITKVNLVAARSDGTAVLLKKFENVDAFDIELDVHFVEKGVARVDSYDDEAYKEQLRCLIYDTSTEQ